MYPDWPAAMFRAARRCTAPPSQDARQWRRSFFCVGTWAHRCCNVGSRCYSCSRQNITAPSHGNESGRHAHIPHVPPVPPLVILIRHSACAGTPPTWPTRRATCPCTTPARGICTPPPLSCAPQSSRSIAAASLPSELTQVHNGALAQRGPAETKDVRVGVIDDMKKCMHRCRKRVVSFSCHRAT